MAPAKMINGIDFNNLPHYYEHQEDCDVTIVAAGGRGFDAHSTILGVDLPHLREKGIRTGESSIEVAESGDVVERVSH